MNEKARIAALRKTAPETIWLQIDEEAEQFDGWDAQTWCSDQINDTDLKYVRADLVEELRPQLAEARAETAHVKEVEFPRKIKAVVAGWDTKIANLEKQLAESKEELSRSRLQNAIVYGTSHPEIYKTVEDELREQVKLLRDAVSYSKHQCEGLRVWGGMEWTYHPWQAKRIFDVCEKAMADTEPKP